MTNASKDKGAKALDDLKTQQQVGTGAEDKAASAKERKASPSERGDPTHDSPKRHGDKLEQARDEAAGRGSR